MTLVMAELARPQYGCGPSNHYAKCATFECILSN